jgi:hypothetical protein
VVTLYTGVEIADNMWQCSHRGSPANGRNVSLGVQHGHFRFPLSLLPLSFLHHDVAVVVVLSLHSLYFIYSNARTVHLELSLSLSLFAALRIATVVEASFFSTCDTTTRFVMVLILTHLWQQRCVHSSRRFLGFGNLRTTPHLHWLWQRHLTRV